MTSLSDWLIAAQKRVVIRFASFAIHRLTIPPRAFYDASDSNERLIEINGAIHRLVGQIIALADPTESLNEGSPEVIISNVSLISADEVARIMVHCSA